MTLGYEYRAKGSIAGWGVRLKMLVSNKQPTHLKIKGSTLDLVETKKQGVIGHFLYQKLSRASTEGDVFHWTEHGLSDFPWPVLLCWFEIFRRKRRAELVYGKLSQF